MLSAFLEYTAFCPKLARNALRSLRPMSSCLRCLRFLSKSILNLVFTVSLSRPHTKHSRQRQRCCRARTFFDRGRRPRNVVSDLRADVIVHCFENTFQRGSFLVALHRSVWTFSCVFDRRFLVTFSRLESSMKLGQGENPPSVLVAPLRALGIKSSVQDLFVQFRRTRLK